MKKKSIENSKQTTTQQKKNLGGRPKGSKNSLTLLQEAAINVVMTKVLKLLYCVLIVVAEVR